jgi:hypothetical protein
VQEYKYTFGGMITTFGTSLYAFSQKFFYFLFNLDLLHPAHFGFLLVMIFLGLGMRPSYIGEQKQDKVDMIYDLRNIWSLIRHKTLYIIILFLLAYLFFYISLYLNQNWYVALFSIFGWLSIIAIMSLIIAHLLILFIKTIDEITGRWKYLPYVTMPISYILVRLLFSYFPTAYTNSCSLLLMIIVTAVVSFLLIRRKTNKFKNEIDMKLSNKKDKGEKDEEK